jgi:hypothetical protein
MFLYINFDISKGGFENVSIAKMCEEVYLLHSTHEQV